jgi:hypothetical protein
MKHPLLLLVAPLGLLIATALAVSALDGRQERGAVYSVGELQMSVQHAPGRWVGRTVRVRGVAWPCQGWAYGPCLIRSPFLADVGADAGLVLARQPAGPLSAVLRAMPLVGDLMLPRQIPQWGVLAAYRVQIRAVPAVSCVYWPCYEALLLDAAPGAPWEG